MQEAVAIADLERDAEGRPIGYRILDANPAFGQEMGVPLDRAVGRLRSEWTQVPNPLLLQNQASWRA